MFLFSTCGRGAVNISPAVFKDKVGAGSYCSDPCRIPQKAEKYCTPSYTTAIKWLHSVTYSSI